MVGSRGPVRRTHGATCEAIVRFEGSVCTPAILKRSKCDASRPFATARSLCAAAILICVVDQRADAHTCGTSAPADCTAGRDTTCQASCDETDLRNAIDVVNRCGGRRTVRFALSGTSSCSIAVRNTSTTASCGKFDNAICVTADDVTIDGRNSAGQAAVTFQYAGSAKCASCGGSACPGPEPALFVLSGSRDQVANVQFEFFAAGIQVDGGSSDAIAAVRSDYLCTEAVRIAGGTGHTVRDSTFIGASDPEANNAGGSCYQQQTPAVACTTETDCAGQRCHCTNGSFASESPNNGNCSPVASGTCFRKALCGRGSGIVVSSGSGHAIVNNQLANIDTPVLVTAVYGSSPNAAVRNNQVSGSSVSLQLSTDASFAIAADRVCSAMTASGTTTSASFEGNTIRLCRYGIRTTQGAAVRAVSNTVTDDYVSGFAVADASTLAGSLNRMRNNGTLAVSSSSDQRGAVVVESNVGARVDFGSRLGGGEVGLNVFCGTLPSISDRIPSCPAGSCCGAPVSAQRNCFDLDEPLVDPYGKVDLTYDGRVGIDPLCTDYHLACNF